MRFKPLLFVCMLLLLGGCYTKQVRHLASDAALIKPGQTTAKEMLRYLGEPNGQRQVSPQVMEYVYYADQPGIFGTAPVLSKLTGPSGYEMIIVTVENELVTACEFRGFNEKDNKWVEDFTWDEVQ